MPPYCEEFKRRYENTRYRTWKFITGSSVRSTATAGQLRITNDTLAAAWYVTLNVEIGIYSLPSMALLRLTRASS